jgi:nucleotide-binding universal stress UspA family protein
MTMDSQKDARRPRVVVGLDDSAGAHAALGYAFTAAARRQADLDIITAYPVNLPWAWEATIDVPDVEGFRAELVRRAEARRAEVGRDAPSVKDVTARVLVARGPAAEVLVEQSEDADLLVVGSRGRGRVRSAVLGSVALRCLTAARCPVVVVHEAEDRGAPAPRPAAEGPQGTRVVVGVDGSAESAAAIRAALREACELRATVEAVAAFSLADVWLDAYGVAPPTADDVRSRVVDRLNAMVGKARAELSAELGSRLPAVRPSVVEGPAAHVLLDRSREASMLVLGNRGHGAVRGLLLGSVALSCAMHATCPVMVVHASAVGQAERTRTAETASA